MISQKKFDETEMEYGCGYWNLCWEHACPCNITVKNIGLTEKIYKSFIKENEKISEEFDKEFNTWDNDRYPDDDISDDEEYEEDDDYEYYNGD